MSSRVGTAMMRRGGRSTTTERVLSGVARQAFKLRAELVERGFALILDRGGVVLPHVILLPAASLRMLPAARCEGSGAAYAGMSPTALMSRCMACWRHARTRFCNV